MARRKPLVCQFLENISRTALEEYEDIIRDFVRGRHGVYALYRRKKLYYVGLARNLRNRLTQHLRDRHGQSWDRFSVYLTIGDGHMKELESLILRIVRPLGNKQLGKFAKSENLRQQLARRIRAYERQRLDELLGRIRILKLDGQGRIRGRAKLDGRQPVLARYIREPMRLRARFKGNLLKAKVRRDGRIRYDGRLFNSPSDAARVAARRRAMNGWWFWTYERAPGDWVKLRELRR